MPIDFGIEDESGLVQHSSEHVDRKSFIEDVVPYPPDQQIPLISSIDPWGKTVFSGEILSLFVNEWISLVDSNPSAIDQRLQDEVLNFARTALSNPKYSLVFYGD